MFTFIVTGDSTFADYNALEQEIDLFLSKCNDPDITIFCQAATNIAQLCEIYAEHKSCRFKSFCVDWLKYKRNAVFLTNQEMAQNADGIIAFWNGKTKISQDLISLMNRKNATVKIVPYSKE